jgi:predicted TIM-barrel fold metal-dependent hydrolase
MIFDSHAHIEKGIINPVEVGLEGYDLEVTGKNYICNFPNLLETYLKYKTSADTLCYIFDFRDEVQIAKTKELLQAGTIQGLKIHSRIQKIQRAEYDLIWERLQMIDEKVPVILDAWYYGSELKYNPDLEGLIQIVKSQPNRKFVIAHAGGYRIIEYFYHTRELENVHYDLSLTTQYLSDSSLYLDFKKFIKWIDKDRILFGSDYPYGSPAEQFKSMDSILKEYDCNSSERESILALNGQQLYKYEG